MIRDFIGITKRIHYDIEEHLLSTKAKQSSNELPFFCLARSWLAETMHNRPKQEKWKSWAGSSGKECVGGLLNC